MELNSIKQSSRKKLTVKFSIHFRIFFSALLTLILFMGLTGIVLDNAFQNNIKNLQQNNLRTQIYALLAAADINENDELQLPEEITEPRLNITESNLYARIITIDDKIVWQSKSILNSTPPFSTKIKTGEFLFSTKNKNNELYTTANFTTIWVTEKGEVPYVFQITENNSVLNSQINYFRKNLWGWLVGVSLLLIIIQILILRWGLKPLRFIAEDLLNIEKGKTTKLSGNYPKEITPLTNNLNQLLESSQQQLIRYRDALGNMAHSLKTPLAVLQGITDNISNKDKDTALEQINTINNIVKYQLQRAATVGKLQLNESTNLLLITQKIVSTLKKVHHDKKIEVNINIDKSTNINIEQGDLYELLGNLLENAFKWAKHRINITATLKNQKYNITIEDDGVGIDEKEKERILLRGQRADQNTPGHGLGLAMVSNILLLYKGNMEIKSSSLGGAKILLTI